MKIQGPGKPPAPPAPTEPRAEEPRGFQVDPPKASSRADAPTATGDATAPRSTAVELARAIDSVAADVRAGRVPRTEAIRRLVAATLDKVVPASAVPSTREAVRQVLEQALAEDPTLRTRLARLGLIDPGGYP